MLFDIYACRALCMRACVRRSRHSIVYYMFVNGGWKLHYIYNDSQLTDWLRLCCCARRRTLKKWRWAWNRIKVQTRHDGGGGTKARIYFVEKLMYTGSKQGISIVPSHAEKKIEKFILFGKLRKWKMHLNGNNKCFCPFGSFCLYKKSSIYEGNF